MALTAIADTSWASTRRARYDALWTSLISERSSFDSHWRDLADFVTPRRQRWTAGDRNRGDKRNQKIINSTASLSLRTLQSGLHAGLTSPARPWFELRTPNPELNERADVRAWLDEVTKRMLSVFALSNIYNVLPIVYGDIGQFATSAMAVLEDDEDIIRAYAYPLGSYTLEVDRRQKVGGFFREYELSVQQVVEEFGLQKDGTIDWSNISTSTRALYDSANYSAPVVIRWCVRKADGYRPGSLNPATAFPWTSCYWEIGALDPTGSIHDAASIDQTKFLKESGFYEFPVMAPRWSVTGEDTYGTDCPGMLALGDVKQLQNEEKQKARAIAKLLDPPLVGPTTLRNQKVSLVSGDITYEDVRDGQKGLRSVHEVNLDVSHLVQDMRGVEVRIQRAYYEDLFLMFAGQDNGDGGVQPVTAREVVERHEEKLLALGPVLERMGDELHDPIIERTYAIMSRRKLLPPAPASLNGVLVRPQYTSVLAQAQKLVAVGGHDRFLQTMMPAIQVFPEIKAKLNPIALVNVYADALGIDRKVIKSDDEAQAAIDASNKAAQQQQQAEMLSKVGPAVAKAGAQPIVPDSPLDRIIANATGAGAGGAALAGG